jgi:DNA processing protein
MAADYNRELLVVPGSIFSVNSAGAHQFLKLGATPVTHAKDILYALSINPETQHQKTLGFSRLAPVSAQEQKILDMLCEPIQKDVLMRTLDLETHKANALLMEMEIKGLIAQDLQGYRAVI